MPLKYIYESPVLLYLSRRWYDIKALNNNSIGDQSSKHVLDSRLAVCEGYAELFNSLSHAMGLNSVKISGFSKGLGYSVGDELPDSINHAWNAVKIDGDWKLLDSK